MDNQDKMEKKVTCDLCPELAKTNCLQCYNINMCPMCCQTHDSNSRKSAHDLFGLCCKHGIPLASYCRTCNQAVCSACEISGHNDEHHDVTTHREVLDETLAKTEKSFTELNGAVLQDDREVQRMLELCAYVKKKSGSAEVDATARTNRTIFGTRTKINDHKDESEELEKQIRTLSERKDEVDMRVCRMEKDAVKLEIEETKIATDVREKITTASEKTEKHIINLKSRKIVKESKINQRRAETSVKITLDADCVPRWSSISQDLMDFAKISPEGDTNTVIEEVKRLVDELMPPIQLRMLECINFPKKQCNHVRKIKNLPAGRLSILSRSQNESFANRVYFNDQTSLTICDTMDGVSPASDMAVISTGELVLTRRERPPIRIFKPDTGAYRDINTEHDGKVIDELWVVETDGDDNMFVTSLRCILVLNPKGTVIDSVPFDQSRLNDEFHLHRRMNFSRVNRLLYIPIDDMLLRFHWSNNKLEEISSSPHGIKGFSCRDVCIGSYGEVLVAGYNGCIKIYQVEYRDGREVCVWREINFQDNVERKCLHWPCLCSKDDQLWLGYDNRVEVFQMLSSLHVGSLTLLHRTKHTNGTADLVDGQNELAETMVQRVVDAVRRSFTLPEATTKESAGEFDTISGDRNFITKDQYGKSTRAYVSKMVPNKNVRKLIRKDVKVQRRKNNNMKLDESQANTGKITKNDFMNGKSYVRLLSSLASYNADGDAVMDRPKFVAWLADRCGIHDAAYADAVIEQFSGGAAELQIKVLLDNLFERAFPTDEARLRRVAECIRKAFKLTADERKTEEQDFEDFCGKGTEFITMERYREIAKAELQKKFPGKNMKKALDAKVKKMEEKDRNQDGHITKTEFIIHRIYWRFENAFEHSYEDEIEEADFAAWLRKTFPSLYSKVQGEAESKLDARVVFDAILPGGELQVLLDGLFDRAFPPSDVRVKRVIEAMRATFGMEPAAAETLMDDFDVLNGAEDFIQMDVYLKLVEEQFLTKYNGTKIPERIVKRLLNKRIDNIKKKDFNNDGKISREEYLNGEIFLAVETSLNTYDEDGDLIMEKPEFISWLAEKCQLYDEAYTDAVMQEFLPDGSLTLKVEDLTEGLFERAFPSADYIVEEMVKGVHELCQLTTEENEDAVNEFNAISGGNSFFTMEQYKTKIGELLNKRYGPTDSSRKKRQETLKLEMMKEKDLNNDGKISKDEYVDTERYIKLDESLREYGENLDDLTDDVMDLEELERWLVEKCQIIDDVKTYAILATQEFLPDDEDQLHLGILAKGLFKRAYPSAA